MTDITETIAMVSNLVFNIDKSYISINENTNDNDSYLLYQE